MVGGGIIIARLSAHDGRVTISCFLFVVKSALVGVGAVGEKYSKRL